MTDRQTLADAYDRLQAVLADLDHDPRAEAVVATYRERITAQLNDAADQLLGRSAACCPKHRGQPAHNCACCLGERKAAPNVIPIR